MSFAVTYLTTCAVLVVAGSALCAWLVKRIPPSGGPAHRAVPARRVVVDANPQTPAILPSKAQPLGPAQVKALPPARKAIGGGEK